MVTAAQVSGILLPWVGNSLLGMLHEECARITAMLNTADHLQSPDILAERIAVNLFSAVRALTHAQMVVHPDGGYPVRMQTEDFSIIADELLFLLFDTFPADEAHFQLLQSYALSCSSLSALRALYTRFASFQSQQELATVAQIARSCHPPFRLVGWLI